MKKKKILMHMGLANYSPEQWTLLKHVADDPEEMDDSHDDWVKQRDKAIENFKLLRYSIQLIDIDVQELMQWCHYNGRKNDKAARAAFFTEAMRKAIVSHVGDGQDRH